MKTKKSISELIKEIAKNPNEEVYSAVCVVSSVNETERTIDAKPVDGSGEIFGCRLQASINSNSGFCPIPKEGSFVLVTFLNQLNGYVALCTEIDKILIDTETEVIFDGGNFGGLVKVEELTSKINALESELNDLKNFITTWIPAPTDGGLALKTLLTDWGTSLIVPTNKTEIENDKIKH